MLNGVDLFSGGLGACSEALAPWVRTIAYCENDDFRRRMLLSRQFRGELDLAPIWTDVLTFPARLFHGLVDIIMAQPPCQDVSVAGLRKGMAGGRTSLLWKVIEIADQTKAPFVFMENTPGIRRHVGKIRDAFERTGYEVRDGILAARDVDARHERKRWFLLAHSNEVPRWLQSRGRRWEGWAKTIVYPDHVVARQDPDTDQIGSDAGGEGVKHAKTLSERFELLAGHTWDTLPEFFHRMDSGVPYRGKRSGALGDSCPPAQYREAFKRLMGFP